MSIANRLTSNGTLYTTGTLDEASFNPNTTYKKNLFVSSADLTNPAWQSNWQILTTNELAPDGTYTACKITYRLQYSIFRQALNCPTGSVWTFSWYVKYVNQPNIALVLDSYLTGQGFVYVGYNIQTGAYQGAGTGTNGTFISTSITPANNGFYRVSITGTAGSYTNYPTQPLLSPELWMGGYSGSDFTGSYMIVWGPQFEVGPSLSIYQPTPLTTQYARTDINGNNYFSGTIDEVTFNPSSKYQKNLIPNSKDITTFFLNNNAYQKNVSNIIAPDQTYNNVTRVYNAQLNLGGDGVSTQIQPNVSPGLNIPITVSVYVKKDTSDVTQLYAFYQPTTKGSYLQYTFSTDTLSVGAADGVGITPTLYGRTLYPNGWVRLYFTVTDANLGTNNVLIFRLYSGNRNVLVNSDSTFYWGPQMEYGSAPTIYEPTAGNGIASSNTISKLDANGNNYITDHYDEYTLNPTVPIYNFTGGNTINQIYWSNNFEFSNTFAAIGGTSINAQTLAPDGTYTARLFTENTLNTYRQVYTGFGFIFPQTNYVVSCYYKPNGRYIFGITVGNSAFGSNDQSAYFNLLNKTIVNNSPTYINSYGIIDVGNGWYRCWINATSGSYPQGTGYASFGQMAFMFNNFGQAVYQGDGISGMYLWGAQVEVVLTKTEGPGIYVPVGGGGQRIIQ
jgi:hypothetical protein